MLSEDDDFITLEVGKHDEVLWHLQQNDEGETVGGDRFFTVLFVRAEEDGVAPWLPWEQ